MRLHTDGKFLRVLPSICMPTISLYSATVKATALLSCLAGALMVVMIKLLDFIGFGSLDPYLGSANQDDLSRVLFSSKHSCLQPWRCPFPLPDPMTDLSLLMYS